MVSMDSKLNIFKVNGTNPFAPAERTAFTGGGEAVSTEGFSDRHGKGMAAGVDSNGVLGSVTGTGVDGKHKLNMYM